MFLKFCRKVQFERLSFCLVCFNSCSPVNLCHVRLFPLISSQCLLFLSIEETWYVVNGIQGYLYSKRLLLCGTVAMEASSPPSLSLTWTAEASPQGGALSLFSCLMFPAEPKLRESTGETFLQTVSHSHWDTRKLAEFKKWTKCASCR